ncbi:MAG: hypothetical protein VKJ24_08090 [Synechococcales bacterium]|nr:hypothetical protein [Synechococcales bacterium]
MTVPAILLTLIMTSTLPAQMAIARSQGLAQRKSPPKLSTPSTTLPKVVIEQLRQDVRQYEPYAPRDDFKIVKVQPRGLNSCLNLPRFQEVCSPKTTQGWRVQFTFNRKTWIYHTSRDRGSRLNIAETIGKPAQTAIAQARQDAAARSQTSAQHWQVLETKPIAWSLCSGGPEGPTQPIRGAMCVGSPVLGWRLKLKHEGQTWVYYGVRAEQGQQTDFGLDDTQSVSPKLVQQVIQATQRESPRPHQGFRLFEAQQITWPDSCLGTTRTKPACQPIAVPGWRIAVMGADSMLWQFHTGLDGDVRFQQSGSWLPPP